MIELTGTLLGEQNFHRALSRLVAATQDFTTIFEKVGEDFRDIEKERFDLAPWTPLSQAYGAWKELHYPGQPVLRLTNKMYEAMTRTQSEDNVSEIHPTYALFGAQGESGAKALWHQVGAGNLPQRTIIEFTEEDKRMFTHTFHFYMVRLGEEAGFFIN